MKDLKGHSHLVNCGKCPICQERKRLSWSLRMQEEHHASETADFITLTYAVNPVNQYGLETLDYKDLKDFIKALKQRQKRQFNSTFRYFAVGEYGTKSGRPHYHLITFNLHPGLIEQIPETWNKGLVHRGDVEPASIHYCTKYLLKEVGKDYTHQEKPKSFQSRKPPIGINYVNRMGGKLIQYKEPQQYSRNGKIYTRLVPKYDVKEIPRFHQEKRRAYIARGQYKAPLPEHLKAIFYPEQSIVSKDLNRKKAEEKSLKIYLKQIEKLEKQGAKEPHAIINKYVDDLHRRRLKTSTTNL